MDTSENMQKFFGNETVLIKPINAIDLETLAKDPQAIQFIALSCAFVDESCRRSLDQLNTVVSVNKTNFDIYFVDSMENKVFARNPNF